MPKIKAAKSTTPTPIDHLKVFATHGVDFDDNGHQATADCPFCLKRKMHIAPDTGLWDCKSCGEKGNPLTFLRKLYAMSEDQTQDVADLANDRKLLYAQTLDEWGVKKSHLTGEWLIPGYNVEGKLCQLYRYTELNGRMTLLGTPGFGHGMLGVNLWDATKGEVFVTEGIWDAMTLYEVLRQSKMTKDGRIVATANPDVSILANTNIVATPSANVFLPTWGNLFSAKRVTFLYDNDHERLHPKTTLPIIGAGYAGMKRASIGLATIEGDPVTSVSYLAWGNNSTFDESLPSGYDVRDALSANAPTVNKRIANLANLLCRIKAIPSDWVEGVSPKNKGSVSVETLPCSSYKVLQNQWKKALKWMDGLDCALTVMLASITSVRLGGDQLWLKIVSPPSCLHGDTPIYDPTNGTTLTVQERYEYAEPFSVWSLDPLTGEVIITLAEPPHTYEAAPMYDVIFLSGKKLRVTAGHKIWNGVGYQSIEDILRQLKSISHNNRSGQSLRFSIPSHNPYIQEHQGINSVETIIDIATAEPDIYYDFCVPATSNYWALGVFHHNTGKSTLCEALAVAHKYVYSKSSIRGFHSGYKSDKEGVEDNSLIAKIRDKTLITKDGDTLLQSPNLPQILSEGRDLYDTTSRSHYRHGLNRDYNGVRMTWILCGTESLRSLDTSELGERFLDCIIMDKIDDELERDISRQAMYRIVNNKGVEANGQLETHNAKDETMARQLTGGYVEFLRENATRLLDALELPSDDTLTEINYLGMFVAFARARPSKTQEENVTREMSTRLCIQLTRLALCTAVVLNKSSVDSYVMKRVRKVAMDTARGRTLRILTHLYEKQRTGVKSDELARRVNENKEKLIVLLKFLRGIEAVEWFEPQLTSGYKGMVHWRLTPTVLRLFDYLYKKEKE